MSGPDLPALLGGHPVRPQGPPGWPPPDAAVRHALEESFRDGSWGKYQGGRVEALERRLAESHGVAHALACGSGTFAVELALRALKVGPGDAVVMAAYDYPGNFLSVHAAGATPILVDLHPDNWNLNPSHLPAACGFAPRAILVSHLHGGIVPMCAVRELADSLNIPVIEDAAQCPGARVEGRPAATWGDVGVLSFGGSKLLSAGRGGALLTNRGDVYQRARLWQFRAGNVVCPLSELQAAVLFPQMDRLAERNALRARRVGLLHELLRDVAGLRPLVNDCGDTEPGYYKVGFRYDAERFGLPRARFLAAVRAEGIAFDEGFRALHVGRSPARFHRAGELAEADRVHAGAVVLHHPVLLETAADIEDVAAAVCKVRAYRDQLSAGADGKQSGRS